MSLPSIQQVALEFGITVDASTSEENLEKILVEAMKRDLGPALEYLHKKSHEAKDGSVTWSEDPKSDLGKMLSRIHASDSLRKIASKHFCHGKELSFANCCNGVVGVPPKSSMLFQVQCQNGVVAYADC